MKLSFFHLMPYQHLPKDFESKHRSTWVDLPNENFDPELGQQHYNEYIDELEYADTLGFDGVCVNEHHGNAYGLMPSPNLIAATLARSTSRSALIVLGNSLALYQPPLRVAEEMAMLDVMSGGRLVAGFPVGTSMDTTFSYGQVPLELRGTSYRGPRLNHAGRGKNESPSYSTGNTTSCATSIPGPGPCSSPIRPCGFPAAAVLRPGTGCCSATTCTAT